MPIDSIQAALCAAGNRGIDTTIIFPARNDDFAVGATSRSYYEDLLAAGVKIVGGCCGTTPAHIAALREALDRVS